MLLILSSSLVWAQQANQVTWTLALENYKTTDMVPFDSPVQSFNGEQYRLVINPAAACFCYVVYESPDGNDVSVLYAGPLKQGEPWYSAVLELTPPRGSESLYIITCREEQKVLAQRIAAFKANAGAAQRRALMNEVFRIRSDASRFQGAPDKPVLMGGASRGNNDKNIGVQYSGSEIYVKTISIEH